MVNIGRKKKHFMISNLKLSNVIFGLVIGYSQMRKKTRKGKGFLICTANPLQSQPCMIPDSRNRAKKIIGKKKKKHLQRLASEGIGSTVGKNPSASQGGGIFIVMARGEFQLVFLKSKLRGRIFFQDTCIISTAIFLQYVLSS